MRRLIWIFIGCTYLKIIILKMRLWLLQTWHETWSLLRNLNLQPLINTVWATAVIRLLIFLFILFRKVWFDILSYFLSVKRYFSGKTIIVYPVLSGQIQQTTNLDIFSYFSQIIDLSKPIFWGKISKTSLKRYLLKYFPIMLRVKMSSAEILTQILLSTKYKNHVEYLYV